MRRSDLPHNRHGPPRALEYLTQVLGVGSTRELVHPPDVRLFGGIALPRAQYYLLSQALGACATL